MDNKELKSLNHAISFLFGKIEELNKEIISLGQQIEELKNNASLEKK